MPAKPLSNEALRLIDAVREALAEHGSAVEEKRMFGCHVFMVNGKLCLGVEDDELLVRLPPDTHAAVAETPGVRTLSSKGLMDGYFYIGPSAYATQAQWQHWVDAALAFNPLAKATRARKGKRPTSAGHNVPAASADRPQGASGPRRHSVFDEE
ncbi:TfoX/Sxy family protein [Comamonas composti]|uniref:TfoX/Sxy family protein n=1 Tax=Comamonas composti TaxID=408558 RepID=UPI0003F95DD5|nr:TfoX/Sxy family protein [Comamonas composti]